MVDKLLLCGLLEAEEVGVPPALGWGGRAGVPMAGKGRHQRGVCPPCPCPEQESERWVCDLAPRPRYTCWRGAELNFSDSEEEEEVPKRCFKVLGVSPPHL